MEKEQFTFYKVYWDAMKDEDNETVDTIVTGQGQRQEKAENSG